MSHWTKVIWLLLVVAAGIALFSYFDSEPEVLVQVAVVESGEVARIVTNTRAGSIKPCRRSRIAPAVGGRVAEVPVSEGDRVTQGQTLLKLWNDDLQARLRLATSERTRTEAVARQICLEADVAGREARRLEQLVSRAMVSEGSADRATTEAKAKAAACAAARASLSVSEDQIAVSEAALDLTHLEAPFAGIVAEVNAEVGEYVTPSPPGIATLPAVDLIDDSCVYVTAPIDEVDAPLVAPGMPTCVLLDAFAEPRCGARVRRIAPYVLELEKQARTVAVEVDFSGDLNVADLLAGYTADVEITVQSRLADRRVPTSALLDGSYVLVLSARGVVERRDVKTGLANWRFTEILRGLDPDEKVIVSVDRDGVEPGKRAVVE